jgi:hypothetical protein
LRKDQAEAKASGTKQDSAAATGPTANRDAVLPTSAFVNVFDDAAAGAKDDSRLRPLPETEYLAAMTFFGLQEERLVEGEILLQSWQSHFDKLHQISGGAGIGNRPGVRCFDKAYAGRTIFDSQ